MVPHSRDASLTDKLRGSLGHAPGRDLVTGDQGGRVPPSVAVGTGRDHTMCPRARRLGV